MKSNVEHFFIVTIVLMVLSKAAFASGANQEYVWAPFSTDTREFLTQANSPATPAPRAIDVPIGVLGAVVLSARQGVPFCAGVKVRPRFYLTAGHCVAKETGPGEGFGAGETILLSQMYARNSHICQVRQIYVHPSFLNLLQATGGYPTIRSQWLIPKVLDLAVVELESEIPDIEQASEISFLRPKENTAIIVPRHTCITKDESSRPARIMRFLADKYFTSSDVSACAGDSGSPAFLANGRNYPVIGIMAMEIPPLNHFFWSVRSSMAFVRLDSDEARSWLAGILR